MAEPSEPGASDLDYSRGNRDPSPSVSQRQSRVSAPAGRPQHPHSRSQETLTRMLASLSHGSCIVRKCTKMHKRVVDAPFSSRIPALPPPPPLPRIPGGQGHVFCLFIYDSAKCSVAEVAACLPKTRLPLPSSPVAELWPPSQEPRGPAPLHPGVAV